MSSNTVALTLGYRGTRYCGWAVQPARVSRGRPSVQATLEAALADVLQAPVRTTPAGRTDAGVHAEGQVVSFETASSITPHGLMRTLSSCLPDDVWVVDAHLAPPGFNARRQARRRWYRYTVWTGEAAPPATWQGRCLSVPHQLDLPAMRRAARPLVGRLDAATLASRLGPGQSTQRTIFAADWLQAPGSPMLMFEVCADAFLRGMVRTLVGCLLWVGRGRWTPQQLWSAIASRDRRAAGPAAPARGLSLHHVDY